MTILNASFMVSGVLLFFGLVIVLFRRNLFFVLLGVQMCFVSIMLSFGTFFAKTQDPTLIVLASIIAIIFSVLNILGTSFAIYIYRHRNTLNVDELRNLRG